MDHAAKELIAVQRRAGQKRLQLERYGLPYFSKSIPEAEIPTIRCNCCGTEFLDGLFIQYHDQATCPVCGHGLYVRNQPVKS